MWLGFLVSACSSASCFASAGRGGCWTGVCTLLAVVVSVAAVTGRWQWWYGMGWHGMGCYGLLWYGMVWYGMVWKDMLLVLRMGQGTPLRQAQGRQFGSIRA